MNATVLFCQLLYYWFSQDVRNNAARSSSVVSSGPRETVTRPNARTLTTPTLAVARRAPGAAQPEDHAEDPVRPLTNHYALSANPDP